MPTAVTIASILVLGVAATLQLLLIESPLGLESWPLTIVAWVVSLITAAHIYGVLMEMFMWHYSGIIIDGEEVSADNLIRKVLTRSLLQLPAVFLWVPLIRESAWAVIVIASLSLTGVNWRARTRAPTT